MNNLVILCTVLFATACRLSAEAYNFQDADFNLLLSSELEEAFDSLYIAPQHPRSRRDEEEALAPSDEKCRRRPRKPQLCCAQEAFSSFHDDEKDLIKQCFKEVIGPDKKEHFSHKKFDLFSCEEVEKRQSDMLCVNECFGKKKGLIGDAGALQPEVIKDTLKKKFTNEPWMEPMLDEIVAKCLAEAKNATENPPKFYTEGVKSCNPAALTLKRCLFKEVQLSCPADQIKDQASCERFRERIKKGMDVEEH